MLSKKITYQRSGWLFAFILFVAGIVVYLHGLDQKGIFESAFPKVLLCVMAGLIWAVVTRIEREEKNRAISARAPKIGIAFQLASRWGMR